MEITRNDIDLAEKMRGKFQNTPEVFFKKYLGVDLWEKEKEIVHSVRDHRRTSVRSCHGPGKTYTAARIGIWFLYAYPPAIVINTAPTGRQVRNQYWKEFREAVKGAKIPLGGELLKTKYTLDEKWFAMGFSTGEGGSEKFQGFHGANILIIVDEASGVSEDIFEAIDGAMTGGGTVRLLLLGNPTQNDGSFAESFTSDLYNHIHISAFDSPNLKVNGVESVEDLKELTQKEVEKAKVVIPGLVDLQYVWDMYHKYGTENDVWRIRVAGDPPKEGENVRVPLHLVETAMNRYTDELEDEILEKSAEEDYKYSFEADEIIGCDPARKGKDKSAIIYRKGPFAKILKQMRTSSATELGGELIRYLRIFPNAVTHIDTIGFGGGVYDVVNEQEPSRCYGVNVAKPAIDRDNYKTLRDEMWANIGDWLGEDGILKPNKEWRQISKPRYEIDSRGRMRVESKKNLRKRGVPSPDVADALGVTLVEPTEGMGDSEIIWLD